MNMEEAQEKLAELLKIAKEKKLKELKIPRNYQQKFELSWKLKICILAMIFSLVYGKCSHLFNTQKVRFIIK